MSPVVDTGHHLKQFLAFYNTGALLTYGADGTVILRLPNVAEEYGKLRQIMITPILPCINHKALFFLILYFLL